MMSVWEHKLVIVRSDPRLFGKVLVDAGETLRVEFFRSVADREVKEFVRAEIHHAALPEQTRVFLEKAPGLWRVGRVVDKYNEDSGAFGYTIKFPNDEIIELHEDSCYVRCLDRYADPSKILAAGCIETQFFADRRRVALRRLRELRAAGQGLAAVLSAAVELVPHQLATVRRVATDRIQRYLLADEVGLGKTIEAGLIIRQLLLDNPVLSAIVAVPDPLVEQWKLELASKCLVDETHVTVVPHSQISTISADRVPSILVVDEAHRLIDTQNLEFFHLRELALRVPRLLLLSATPALGHVERLHALLNLLDPAAYPSNEVATFKKRVEERQQIGRLLLTMQPGASSFVLKQQAKRALELFPDDPAVLDDASRLLAGIDDSRDRDAITSSLRDHIANTYRIHQRLIRARRSDVERWTMRPRGPAWPSMTHVRLCFGESPVVDKIIEAIEAWRDGATRAVESDATLREPARQRWLQIVSASWQGALELSKLTKALPPIFPDEDAAILQLTAIADVWCSQDDRYARAATTVRDWQRELARDVLGRPKKIVCFASSSADALRLLEALEALLGSARVISLVGLGSETAEAVQYFAAAQPISVAVCDSACEEGVNLQFVHGIFHMDLPFEAARVEQRIGRLDRFGRRLDKVEHRIFLPTDSEAGPWRAWLDLLGNGFQVFNRSVSDVQFRLESIELHVAQTLFGTGSYELESLTEFIAGQIAEERTKLDEQHSLDGLAQLLDAGDELLQSIESSEDDEAAIAADIDPWIRQVLGLRVETIGDPAAHSLEFCWGSDTLIPEIPWRRALEPCLHNRWTWRRRQVLQPRVAAPQLLRPGATIFEVLERLALWDDRGIAYATWRIQPNWIGIWQGFRFVWIVQPGIVRRGAIYGHRDDAELARRAESFLPVITVEQFVDAAGNSVTDERVLEVLRSPYRVRRDERGGLDVNLGSRPELLQQAMERRDFVDVVETLASRLRESVLTDPRVGAVLRRAGETCERDVRKATRSLEIRARLADGHPGLVERPLPAELDDLNCLLTSIRSPDIRLDEVGYFVVASSIPQ